jgi:hypothetical protein
MEQKPSEATFFYRFVKQFEHLIGAYFLPISLFLESGKLVHTGELKGFVLFSAFFYFELLMWVLKEQKNELKKDQVFKLNYTLWLFQVYSLSSLAIALYTLTYSWSGFYLLIMTIGFYGKYLILKRVSNQI